MEPNSFSWIPLKNASYWAIKAGPVTVKENKAHGGKVRVRVRRVRVDGVSNSNSSSGSSSSSSSSRENQGPWGHGEG